MVWQKSLSLIKNIHQITSRIPRNEIFDMTSQMRRCAISIPCNIAEGFGRHSTRDYIRFLRISMGSIFEMITLIEISRSLELIQITNYDTLIDQVNEIEKMLHGLIKSLSKTQ